MKKGSNGDVGGHVALLDCGLLGIKLSWSILQLVVVIQEFLQDKAVLPNLPRFCIYRLASTVTFGLR